MEYSNDFEMLETIEFEDENLDFGKEIEEQFSEPIFEPDEKDMTSKYKYITDEEIIFLYKNGDEHAFEFLVDKYKFLINIKIRHNFLRGADKDDLIQEGFIGLYKAIRDYDPNKAASFKVFAELCVTRQINSAIKMATRQKHIPLNSYLSLNNSGSDDTDRPMFDMIDIGGYQDPMSTLIDNEAFTHLEDNAMKELSTFELQVLGFYLNNLSYHHISERTGKSVKSVDNALQRIKKKIEKIIKDNQIEA